MHGEPTRMFHACLYPFGAGLMDTLLFDVSMPYTRTSLGMLSVVRHWNTRTVEVVWYRLDA